VTGSAGASTLGKRSFVGKEYDYLFDIDINGAMLKLPFNRGDDPWMVGYNISLCIYIYIYLHE